MFLAVAFTLFNKLIINSGALHIYQAAKQSLGDDVYLLIEIEKLRQKFKEETVRIISTNKLLKQMQKWFLPSTVSMCVWYLP